MGMIFQIPKARLWLIPQSIKHQRAARHAREQFFLQNLHQTSGRTGILIFVSVAEHYVEIIVDSAIADVVDNTLWDHAVNEFVDHVRNGEIVKHVDLHIVFERVLDRLAAGGVVGIFPEGGSHDRTDLLPLKVGVALIAYSAFERDGLNVPIIPVGLNYFRTHRWRGKAIVEYGDPVYIDPSTLKDYRAGGEKKREVCNEFLDRIRDSMRSVIVSMPDYESLQIIHTARRLYQRSGIQGKEKQDLLRRFAAGYKILMDSGDPPPAWLDLQQTNRSVPTRVA